MWRKLLTVAHADRNGDHELFIWAMNVREMLCREMVRIPDPAPPPEHEPRSSRTPPKAGPACIPFDPRRDFGKLTATILESTDVAPEPYSSVLRLLDDCQPIHFGKLSEQQGKGASYKQLAAVAHKASMAKEERVRWYGLRSRCRCLCGMLGTSFGGWGTHE